MFCLDKLKYLIVESGVQLLMKLGEIWTFSSTHCSKVNQQKDKKEEEKNAAD